MRVNKNCINLPGRDKEIETLINSYYNICDGNFETIFVNGMSGTGKTALVYNTFTNLTHEKGYFITGKFNKYVGNEPYSPFIQAFSQMIHYILSEPNERVEELKKILKRILRNNSSIISTMIPEIELIIGKQKLIEDFDIEKVKVRFERVFIKFLQAFATKEHPLIFFVDDFQWADEASLELMKAFITAHNNKYLLIVGTYREEDVDKKHRLKVLMDRVNKEDVEIKQFFISNLNLVDTYKIVREYIDYSHDKVKKIAEHIYLKTLGNPFYTTQMLTLLSNENIILCNDNDVEKILEYIDNIKQNDAILDMLFERIQRTSDENIYLIKLLSCIGQSFDLKSFSIIISTSMLEGGNKLKVLVEENILIPLNFHGNIISIEKYIEIVNENRIDNITYRFIHDKIYNAAYNMLREEEKKEIHLDIGRKLINNLSQDEINNNIFKITSHMNCGLSLIVDYDEKIELAKLNYKAGIKAKRTSAFNAAEQLFEIALELLPDDYRQLKFNLNYELYQCKFIMGKLDEATKIFDILVKSSTSMIEKSKVYILNTILFSCVSRYEEAVEEGIKALSYLDIHLKNKHYNLQLVKEAFKAILLFRNNRVLQLNNLKETDSEKTLLALKTMVQLAPAANLYNEDLFAIIILKMANIAAKEKSKYSPIGYAGYAIFASDFLSDFKKVKKIEKLTLDLCSQYDDETLSCITYFIISTFISHWNSHGRISLQYAHKSFDYGIESGEIFFAGYAMTTILEMKYVLGKSLKSIENDCKEFYNYATSMDFGIVLDLINVFNLMIEELRRDTFSIDVNFFKEIEQKLLIKDSSEIMTYYILLAQLLLLKGKYKEALLIGEKAHKKLNSIKGYIMYAEHIYDYSLAITLSYNQLSISEQRRYMKVLSKNQKRMKKFALHCKENFQHKYLLIEAEINRINNNHLKAMELYDEAIKSAKDNGYIQNVAIINECAAKYYKSIGRENVSKVYINEAYKNYLKWGAKSKVNQIFNEWEGISNEIKHNNKAINMPVDNQGLIMNTEKEQESIEVSNIMKVYNNIENNLGVDQCMISLLEGLIEITGSDKGAILIEENENLYIKAYKEALKNNCKFNSFLDLCDQLPKRVIRYVGRTNKTILLSEDIKKSVFFKDKYMIDNRPSSIVCIPFIYNSILIGIIYLEINMTTEKFNDSHIEAANILLNKVIHGGKLEHLVQKNKIENSDKSIPSNIKLSRREKEVLQLLAQGMSNKEIAEELTLTVNTIKTHSVSIYNKLGVNKRIQAVMKAKELGLIKE